jgi:SAM-dependent methyltransferase
MGLSRTIAACLPLATAALDIDTGGGEVLAGVPTLPPRMCVTESWPPNLERARELLSPRGVEVVRTGEGDPLPFPDASFDLVISRHPVRPQWAEIARVLRGGGTYLAQHVGPASAFELIEFFLGPLPEQREARHPDAAVAAAEAAGLTVVDLARRPAAWSASTSAPLSTSCTSAFGGSPTSVWTAITATLSDSTPRSAVMASSRRIPPATSSKHSAGSSRRSNAP